MLSEGTRFSKDVRWSESKHIRHVARCRSCASLNLPPIVRGTYAQSGFPALVSNKTRSMVHGTCPMGHGARRMV